MEQALRFIDWGGGGARGHGWSIGTHIGFQSITKFTGHRRFIITLHLHQCWETGGVSIEHELRIMAYKQRNRGDGPRFPAQRVVREEHR